VSAPNAKPTPIANEAYSGGLNQDVLTLFKLSLDLPGYPYRIRIVYEWVSANNERVNPCAIGRLFSQSKDSRFGIHRAVNLYSSPHVLRAVYSEVTGVSGHCIACGLSDIRTIPLALFPEFRYGTRVCRCYLDSCANTTSSTAGMKCVSHLRRGRTMPGRSLTQSPRAELPCMGSTT
jgi:hypothetical protein